MFGNVRDIPDAVQLYHPGLQYTGPLRIHLYCIIYDNEKLIFCSPADDELYSGILHNVTTLIHKDDSCIELSKIHKTHTCI